MYWETGQTEHCWVKLGYITYCLFSFVKCTSLLFRCILFFPKNGKLDTNFTNFSYDNLGDYLCVAENNGGVMERTVTLTFDDPSTLTNRGSGGKLKIE